MYLGKIDGPTIDVQVGEIPVPSKVVFTAYAILNTDGSVGIQYYADLQHTLAAQCQIVTSGSGSGSCWSEWSGATEYAVIAQADNASVPNPDEVLYAPASATRAYVPGLIPGVSYTLTVYAIGSGGGVLGSQSGVIPFDPLPGILAGQGIHGDVAVNATTGKPDDTGTAGGRYTAGLSGNGQYAFFFTEADSNLAPASIFNPGSGLVYLVRKNLLTGVIDVASIGLDGHTPVAAAPASGNGELKAKEITVSADGSGSPEGPLALNKDGSAFIYWTPGPGSGSDDQLYYYRNGSSQAAPELSYTGLSSASISLDGSLVLYTLVINDLSSYPGVYAWQPAS